MKTDVDKCGLASIDPLERDVRKAGVRHVPGAANLIEWDTDSNLI